MNNHYILEFCVQLCEYRGKSVVEIQWPVYPAPDTVLNIVLMSPYLILNSSFPVKELSLLSLFSTNTADKEI